MLVCVFLVGQNCKNDADFWSHTHDIMIRKAFPMLYEVTEGWKGVDLFFVIMPSMLTRMDGI